MNKNKNKSDFLNATSLGVAAVTLSLAAQIFAPVAAAFAAPPAPANGLQQQRPDADKTPMTYEQRVMAGMLGSMTKEEKFKVPMSKWVMYLAAIAEHGEYDEIPSEIEALIPLAEYYKAGAERPPVIDILIQTRQLAAAREAVRNSLMPDYLTKKHAGGYIVLSDVIANGEWDALSQETRAALSKDRDLWMSPVALAPTTGSIMEAPVTIAARNRHLDIVPDDVIKSMHEHPSWGESKRAFLLTAVEQRQMDFLKRLGDKTAAFWQSFSTDDFTVRDESGSNLVDRFAETAQAHLLPESVWKAVGIGSFTAINPQTKLTPLYLIASTRGAAQKFSAAQLDILHQATKKDLMFEDEKLKNADDENAGVTVFFNALYQLQPELISDKVWAELTREDVTKIRSDGHPFAYWAGNAGAADRIGHLLSKEEMAQLPAKGTVAADPSDWKKIDALKTDLARGIIDKDKWMERGPYGLSPLSQYIRMVPPDDVLTKLLSRFTYQELTDVENEKGEFPLLFVAVHGLLKCVPSDVWFKIRVNPEIMTRKTTDGRFILNLAAKNSLSKQLSVIPASVLERIPRKAYFTRDNLGGFPFLWAVFSGQEKNLPFNKGIFRPSDLLIVAPSKADALTHLAIRDKAQRKQGLLKEGEGPLAEMLRQFPFEAWRVPDEPDVQAGQPNSEAGTKNLDTPILKLARNGEMSLMPWEGFRSHITSADLEVVGPYDDSVLYWLASDMYVIVKGAKEEWHHALDLVDPAAVANVKPELWTKEVRPAAASGSAVDGDEATADELIVTEQMRYSLGKRGFALLGSIQVGFLPPSSYQWTAESFTKLDGYGDSVIRELDRQGKLDNDRLHDLARLGLLDKDAIPPYIMLKFRKPESWLHKPAGAAYNTFEEAVRHRQIAAADWGNTGRSVLQAIPAEAWYERHVDGFMPVRSMILDGDMKLVPDKHLYESPQFWTEKLLAEVYNADNWHGAAAEMKNLWDQQVSYIEFKLKTAGGSDPADLKMIEEKAALYKSFAPQFKKNYERAAGAITATPLPSPAPQ